MLFTRQVTPRAAPQRPKILQGTGSIIAPKAGFQDHRPSRARSLMVLSQLLQGAENKI